MVVLDRQLNLDTTSTTTTTTTAAAATTTSATTCTTNNNTEINNLNKITVSLNLQERLNGSIDSISHRQIIQVMQEHGVCVIEGLFKKTSNDIKKKWGQGVKKDMDDIIQALQTNHNINLMDHKQADKLASNFVEIGSRYDGEFREGKRWGLGLYTSKEGEKGMLYNGEWRDNICSGKGFWRDGNGNSYDGDWDRNMRHGSGVHYCSNAH